MKIGKKSDIPPLMKINKAQKASVDKEKQQLKKNNVDYNGINHNF